MKKKQPAAPAPQSPQQSSKGKKVEPRKKKTKPNKDDMSDTSEQERSKQKDEKPLSRFLKSSPLYQRGIVALVEKVRRKQKSSAESVSKSISADEIMYPTHHKNRAKKGVDSQEREEGQSTLLQYDTCAEISAMCAPRQSKLAYSGMPVITNNKTNNSKLFVDDMPFWWSEEISDITDDEIVMNASVIIDVLEGRLKLVPMPDIQIILDPVEDVSILQARDFQCFTRDIVFGNTVRSMVNLNELSIRALSSKRVRKKVKAADPSQVQQLEMEEPTTRVIYSRDDMNDMYTEDYNPTKTVRIKSEPQLTELPQQ